MVEWMRSYLDQSISVILTAHVSVYIIKSAQLMKPEVRTWERTKTEQIPKLNTYRRLSAHPRSSRCCLTLDLSVFSVLHFLYNHKLSS